MVVQAALAKRAIGPRTTVPPYADGRYLPPGETTARGTSLRLAVLGDSGAAGLGADEPENTPGAVIARELAAAAGRPVLLTNTAVVGAQSKDLAAQVDRILAVRPHVAVIMVGANDVTHRVRPQHSVRLLGDAVARLRAAGCEVVVGTCPDLGTVKPAGGAAAPVRPTDVARARGGAARSRRSSRAVDRSCSARSSASCSTPTPSCSSPPTGSTPRRPATPPAPHALLPEVLAALGIASTGEIPALPSA